MFCPVDIKCDTCNHIWEYDKGSVMNDVPKNIICPLCTSTKTRRVFGFQAFDVAQGRLGNAKDQYSNGIVYHKSRLAGGRGTRVK